MSHSLKSTIEYIQNSFMLLNEWTNFSLAQKKVLTSFTKNEPVKKTITEKITETTRSVETSATIH